MSRIEYYDDEGGISPELWRACFRRASGSARGQALWREVEAALVALPTKRLIESQGAVEGDVCVLGAVDWHRRTRAGMAADAAMAAVEQADDCFSDPWWAAHHLGIAKTISWWLMERNDEIYGEESPEGRYAAVLADVREMIRAEGSER